ncbi:MAG: bifunctional DNA-formamidopyrimidine glycosylase/DNA-(apurinic or apyrimidinic site) lyase [Proteobacteria bacterium]|nr:bifunctional DNA-formamidopyrimidine glycosylase/DNA-(apurinic or apyrimidinic site) lyase [Pseudomonadota bacterium]
MPRMPELPEVETIRRQIAPLLEGRHIARAWAGLARITRPSVDAFVEGVRGRRIEAVRRRGKHMFLPLDDGSVLRVHLGMTGRLEVEPLVDVPPSRAHVHAVLELSDGQRLVFSDPRTFGEIGVTSDLSFLDALGPEPLDDGFDEGALVERLRSKRCAVKTALLDQRMVAGVGNIYADEICFLGGVRPDRVAATLSRARLARLVSHIRPVLERAVETQGATARPTGRYYDIFGQSGAYIPHVYGRTGEPCAACGTSIKKASLGAGRSARAYHWCSRCQR